MAEQSLPVILLGYRPRLAEEILRLPYERPDLNKSKPAMHRHVDHTERRSA
jgi:hypothetical protein